VNSKPDPTAASADAAAQPPTEAGAADATSTAPAAGTPADAARLAADPDASGAVEEGADTSAADDEEAFDHADFGDEDDGDDDEEGDAAQEREGVDLDAAFGKPAAVEGQRCGLVAIVGRPNVGKSTLLNALVGQKVSITSRKAQTTRHRITGIRTEGDTQFVFVDTPGFQTKHSTALNRNLNRTVQGVLSDVDVVLFLVEAGRFGLDDAKVLALLPPDKPVLLIANKLDAVQRRNDMLPWLKSMQERRDFAEFVPLSARKEADVQRLVGIVRPYLPEQPWFYEEDALTDRSDRFLASELIREKLFRLTGDELPYSCTVVIDKFQEEGRLRRIAATIIVERDAHKGMVIGDRGEVLKRIGSEARQELERLMDAKVFLELWVKVRSGWADSEEHLRSYGYE
jgi:GTP-binding protein Era